MLRMQKRIYTFLRYLASLFQRYRPYWVGIDGKVITNKKRFGKFSGLFYDTSITETAVEQAFILPTTNVEGCRCISPLRLVNKKQTKCVIKRFVDM